MARHRAAFLDDYAERFDWAGDQPRPVPGRERRTPDADGIIRFGGGLIRTPMVTEVRSLDLDDGDRLVFVNYDQGTFKGITGGNPLVVNDAGTYVHINALADVDELDRASPARNGGGRSRRGRADPVYIDKVTGLHEVVIQGYGLSYAESYDVPLI